MPKRNKVTGLTLRQTNQHEYDAWLNALHRCHNPGHYSYSEYGGRGISVCDEWRKAQSGFTTFLKDMGARPGTNFSVERLDNDAGYSKDNCVWADRKTQSCNRRKARLYQLDFGLGYQGRSPLIEYKGRIQSMSDWARELGMEAPCLRQRLKRGMTVEQAFTATTAELKSKRKRNVLEQITIH